MKYNYHFLSQVLFSILITLPLKAEVLHWPQICQDGELHITNKSSDSSNLWLQKFGKTLIGEIEVEVPSKSKIIYKLDRVEEFERYSLLNLNDPGSIEFKYKCNNLFFNGNSLEGGILTFNKTNLPINKVWIQNLYSGNNTVSIEIYNSLNKLIRTENLDLKHQEQIIFYLHDSSSDWAYFKISSQYKFSSFNLTSEGNALPINVNPVVTNVDLNASYFLIQSKDNPNDSFIAKISDSKIVAEARNLIQNQQKEKMLFAKIQKDHQGFNRNWSKSEKNLWSWSTKEVTGFGEIGSTACNGTPQEVEDRVDYWVNDPGLICFWNYRVKKELSPKQVQNGL